jgi:ferredoxin
MASPHLIRTLINKTFELRFLLSRLSHIPVFGKAVDRLLFEGDDLMILPRDRVIPVGKTLDRQDDMVLPSMVLERIIRRSRAHWIMDFCICRESAGCQSYPHSLGCLFMGEAAMEINPRFGRPVSCEEALEHVHRCREAGLVHLVGRNKLDATWLNVGPPNRLFTVCNCCPCCCLWRILPIITPLIGDKLTRMPGVRVAVGEDCSGCGRCVGDVCFAGAIRMERGKAVIGDGCRGCGRCIDACPQGNIRMEVEDGDAFAAAFERLAAAVDLR